MSTTEFKLLFREFDRGKDNSELVFRLYNIVTAVASRIMNALQGGIGEEFSELLATWSHSLNREINRLEGVDNTLEYELGRMAGIIEVFEMIRAREQEQIIIESALVDALKYGKQSSKRILVLLNKYSTSGEWVSRSEIETECALSKQALSNIMKRLLSSYAVEETREGNKKSYRLTPAGIRYCEKYLVDHDEMGERYYVEILNQIDALKNHIDEEFVNVKKQIKMTSEYWTPENDLEFRLENTCSSHQEDSSITFDKLSSVYILNEYSDGNHYNQSKAS